MNQLSEQIRLLSSAEERGRLQAAEELGWANSMEGVEPLCARLRTEPSRVVREAILRALSNIADDRVIEVAIGLLGCPDELVRNEAVSLLKQRGPKVIGYLAPGFQSAGRDEQKLMLDVLADLDSPMAREIYSAALRGGDLMVMITAVETLGNAMREEFRDEVEDLLVSAEPMLAAVCMEALAKIGSPDSLALAKARVGIGMADYLRPSYLKMLAALGDERHLAEACAMLVTAGGYMRGCVLDAIVVLWQRMPALTLPESLAGPLLEVARDGSSPLARHQALHLLGGLTRIEAVAAFLVTCREPDDESGPGRGHTGD